MISSVTGARMVLYWPSACGGLFGLAADGPKEGLRLTHPVTTHPGEVVRVIEVPALAAGALSDWAPYVG